MKDSCKKNSGTKKKPDNKGKLIRLIKHEIEQKIKEEGIITIVAEAKTVRVRKETRL